VEEKVFQITDDATVYKGWVQLHYKHYGSALPIDKCPPFEELKRGRWIKVYYEHPGKLARVELLEGMGAWIGAAKMTQEEEALWAKLGSDGELVAFRFEDTSKRPVGLVIRVGEEKYIVRPEGVWLTIEPYW